MAALGLRRWLWPRRHATRKLVRRDNFTRLSLERLEERCLPSFFGSFSQAVYSVVGDGRATQIAVLLSTSPVNGPIATNGGQHPVLQIDFATTSGSAIPGTDYTGNTSGTLTFPGSDWVESFPVQTIARTAPRGDRTVNLRLTVHTNGGMQLGDPSTSVLHITDPPPLPTVSFASNNTQSVTEINGGTAQVSATIVVGGGVTPAFPMVVNWGAGFAGDTAQPGTDYQLASPTQLTFNYPGSYPVTVNIRDDNSSDATKTLTLWIDRNVLNGQLIGPSTDTITIYEPPVAQALVSLPTWTFQQN